MADRTDTEFMKLALDQAFTGEETPGGAEVGAVLVRDGEIIGAGFNEGELRHDPTAHAEMVVVRRACERLNTTSLKGCTLYSTLQPCGMCTMACLWAGISRIVFGAGRDDVHYIYFESRTMTHLISSEMHSAMTYESREEYWPPTAPHSMRSPRILSGTVIPLTVERSLRDARRKRYASLFAVHKMSNFLFAEHYFTPGGQEKRRYDEV